MLLTDERDDSFEYGSLILHLDMSFNNIIMLFNLLNDEDFSSGEKAAIGLELLLIDYEKLDSADPDEKGNVFLFILREYLDIDLEEQQEKDQSDESDDNEEHSSEITQKKTMDFEVDDEAIYSSFIFDYNVDLVEQQGVLHWNKFKALLNGLSEDSALMKIVNIRTMDVPEQTKHNSKERQRIIRLKNKYALEQSENVVEQNLNNAATYLRGMTKDGGK